VSGCGTDRTLLVDWHGAAAAIAAGTDEGKGQMAWFRHAASLLSVICLLSAAQAAHAQNPGSQVEKSLGSQVEVSYDVPTDAQFQPIYQELKQRQVLGRLQGFLAPLRLPKKLTVRTAQCGAMAVAYKSGGPVTVCYELVKHIIDIAQQNTKDPNEQALMTYGTFIETALHHIAYAVFDLLNVPIFGREDDAADRLAAFTMMQFGDKVAYTTIVGAGTFFQYSKKTWTGSDFASETSPDAQRFFNYLCIAYGGDPLTFQFVAPRPGPSQFPRLSEERAAHCGYEYQQVRHAFDLRIMPYIDPEWLIQVRAGQWLNSDEITAGVK
jgi:hypothetical protein